MEGRDRWFRGLGFGAGENTGEDEIDAVELDDLENDDITEEETKTAGVDAASCNPKLPKAHGQPELNRNFCLVPEPSCRTFGWIFAKMRHFVSHLSPDCGPFPSKFPNFGLQNVPIVSSWSANSFRCTRAEITPGQCNRVRWSWCSCCRNCTCATACVIQIEIIKPLPGLLNSGEQVGVLDRLVDLPFTVALRSVDNGRHVVLLVRCKIEIVDHFQCVVRKTRHQYVVLHHR